MFSPSQPSGRLFVRQLLAFFLPVAILSGVLLWVLHIQDQSSERARTEVRQRAAVDMARQAAVHELQTVASDLLVLAGTAGLRSLASASDPAVVHIAATDLREFARRKRVYGDIRYVSTDGHERLRVHIDGDMLSGEAGDPLKDILRTVLALPPGSLFISRFAPATAAHDGRQPVLLFATSLAGPGGAAAGALILTYHANHLLTQIQTAMESGMGTGMLLDATGRRLWDTSDPPGAARSFATAHTATWRQMAATDTGQVTTSAGVYSFATIRPLQAVAAETGAAGEDDNTAKDDGDTWKLVNFTATDTIQRDSARRARTGIMIYLALLTVWLAASAYIARIRTASSQSRELLKRLSSVVQQTNDIVYVTDREGTIEYVNPSFERVTGFSAATALGRKPNILKSGEHERTFYTRLWDTILAGNVFQDVVTNRTRDGSLYYEQKTITPLKDARGRTSHFVSTGKDITEQMHAQERLYHLAFHNPLTDLPNRTLFRDRLIHATARAHRTGRLIALMFLDLDRFKNVNDSLGHEAGDRLLEAVAQRLRECVRETDTVAHVGGDEFAVILDDVGQVDQVTTVAQKILSVFEQSFAIGASDVFVTVSVGIVLYPLDDTDIDHLIKDADTAMYHAKALGRNRYEFYSSEMTYRVTQRLTLETELRRALERQEFVIYYQPVVDLASNRITGVEALLRWQHPERGLVLPAEFVPVLEESGLIVPITHWILEQGCAHGQRLQAAGLHDLSVAVNVSAPSFLTHKVLGAVEDTLKLGCIAPGQLVVEITESVLMENTQVVVEGLQQLRDLGVRIAIDDFGTGYSSLSYLKRFPVDILKIDREFVRHLPESRDDAALASAIIAMARSLNIKVVAEGVETREQMEFLRMRRCDALQGYLFSTPIPIDDMVRLLERQQPFPWAADTGS